MKDYIIYMVLLAFLLFNLYVMLVGQRRKKMSAADVKRQEGELGRIALEEQKKHGIKFTAHSTYMNDKGKVILAAIDPKKKYLGIFFRHFYWHNILIGFVLYHIRNLHILKNMDFLHLL